MELKHEFVVPIGLDEAWKAFNDLRRIAPCFPGAEVTSVSGDDFTGTAKIKLGPISLNYVGSGTWAERDEERHHAVIRAKGKDKRGGGDAGAIITAHLELQPSGTRVVVETDLTITGRPAQFGRSVIEEVSNKLLDQFVANLSRELAAPDAVTPADEPAGEPATARPVAAVPPAPRVEQAAELDMARLVGPVLLRRFAPAVVSFVLGAAFAFLVARRRSH